MRFHSIASFILRRHRAVIPAADLAVSPAQCRYLEQERRIRRQIFICRILFLVLFLFSWEISARIGILNDFIFSSPSRVLSCFLSMDDLLPHGSHGFGDAFELFSCDMDRDLRRGGALVQQAAGKDSGTVPCHIEQSAEVRSRAAAHRMAGQQHEDDHHGGGLCGGIWLDLNALQRLSLHGS